MSRDNLGSSVTLKMEFVLKVVLAISRFRFHKPFLLECLAEIEILRFTAETINMWFQFTAQPTYFLSILSFDIELRRAKLYV
jgi:hypothetical protein